MNQPENGKVYRLTISGHNLDGETGVEIGQRMKTKTFKVEAVYFKDNTAHKDLMDSLISGKEYELVMKSKNNPDSPFKAKCKVVEWKLRISRNAVVRLVVKFEEIKENK